MNPYPARTARHEEIGRGCLGSGGWVIVLAAALLAAGCSPARQHTAANPPPTLTHGVAVGDVDGDGAVVWGRCSGPGKLEVEACAQGSNVRASAPVEASRDLTARARLEGLEPGTHYSYRAWCEGTGGIGPPVEGSFDTAPTQETRRAVRIVWGGDIGGQNVCRDRDLGYPIFDRIAALHPEVFIGLGDLIYADDPCLPVGLYGNAQVQGPAAPALDLESFHAVWRYDREDPGFQRLLASTSYLPIWDDHEIKNDSGPRHDTLPLAPSAHLLPNALRSFLDYHPIAPPQDDPLRLYRRLRWGEAVEIFVLDTRQYRDANAAPDTGDEPKTMLGPVQRQWLIDGVAASDATWKLVVSSVPMSIPTGTPQARDGWASGEGSGGFERELLGILRAWKDRRVRNLVWITTDIHFGAAFRYRPFDDFEVYEIATGPLNAGVFPRDEYDHTLHPERLLFYGPPSPSAIADFDAAQGWFNFGVLDFSASGALAVRVVSGRGDEVYRLDLP